MTKEKILQTEVWKRIQEFNPVQRYSALFGDYQSRIEKDLNVKIEKWSYAQLNNVTNEMVSITVTDLFNNKCCLAVLIPL